MARFTSSGGPARAVSCCNKRTWTIIIGVIFICVGIIGGSITYSNVDEIETAHEESTFQEYRVVSLEAERRFCFVVENTTRVCLPGPIIDAQNCNVTLETFPVNVSLGSSALRAGTCRRSQCCVSYFHNDTTRACADFDQHYSTSSVYAGSCGVFVASLESIETSASATFRSPDCDDPRGCPISWEASLAVNSTIWLWTDNDIVSLEKPPDSTTQHWIPVWIFVGIFVAGMIIVLSACCKKKKRTISSSSSAL